MSKFDIVCFDFDSTLSRIEGIDELAIKAGVGPAMIKLTNAAMEGSMSLADVYRQRLALIRPNQQMIEWLASRYIEEKVDGSYHVIRQLINLGKQVHIISGGILQALLPMALDMGIDEKRVHAVSLQFASDGAYQSYDDASPLTQNGGKAEICKSLAINSKKLVMIGDGKTDLEVANENFPVIGFGGVVKREIVLQQADYFIHDKSLFPLLELIE